MTAAAVAAIAPASARDLRRCKPGEAADADRAPFASLLGSEPASTAPASSSEKPAAKDAPDDADAPDAADGASALPPWLLALREPPPATVSDPRTAEGAIKDSGLMAGAADGSVPGPGVSLDALRALKAAPGSTPPTQAPPLPTATEAGAAAAADAPISDGGFVLPAPLATVATADPSLDAQQSAALDAALAQADAGSAAARLPTVPVAADRAAPPVPVGAPAPNDPTAAGILNNPPGGGLSNAVDAFGEPLSLQGQDAALRLGERLRWLRDSGVQEARLQLHPRELGSVDIRIRIEGQGASVWFGADHPGARAALEASLPQLRDRLAGEGLQLAQASVGSQGADSNAHHRHGGENAQEPMPSVSKARSGDGESRETGAAVGMSTQADRSQRGLVDRYA